MAAIQVRGLHKRYGRVNALRGIDLTIEEGEVFALLGPNGAGKTTTVEILEGHRRRTSGEVSVLGMDPEPGGGRLRRRIGIVLQEAGIDGELTLRELLRLFASLYPHPRSIDEVIDLVGMAEQADVRVKALSGGQRRRVDLALGLVGDPELLFLDEPTTGFDPSARRRAWEMIDGLRALGKTIVLTTHYMDEAQRLADRVAIIVGGRIVAHGPPRALVADVTRIDFRLPDGPPELPRLRGTVTLENGWVSISSPDPVADLHLLTAWALERESALEDLTVTRPSLEEAYLRLTGEASG